MAQSTPNLRRNESESNEKVSAYAMWLAERLQVRLDTERENLRASQVRTMEKTIAFLKEGKLQGLIKQPTGAGKTRIFGEMLAGINLPSLVLVPRVTLVQDTKNEMVGNKERDIEGLGFLDEEVFTIAPVGAKSTKSELDKVLKAIHKIKEDKKNFGGMTIMTYQSFLQLVKNHKSILRKLLSELSVVVSDEAHRSLGQETRAALENLTEMSTEAENVGKKRTKKAVRAKIIETIDGEENLTDEALEILDIEEDNEEKEIEKILREEFELLHLRFTATPKLSEKEVQTTYDIPIIDWVKIQDLLKTGDLILPQLPSIGNAIYNLPDENGIYIGSKVLGDLVAKDRFIMEDGRSVQEAATEMYLKKKKEAQNYLPAVAFCETIEQAERYKKYLISQQIRAVRSTSSNKQFDKGVSPEVAKKMFHENTVDVVVTVSKVGEGWDVPTLRCAIWLTVTHSPARALQGNGRIMRKLQSNSHHPEKNAKNTFIIEPNWVVKKPSNKKSTPNEIDKTESVTNGNDDSQKNVFESSNFYELLYKSDEIDMDTLEQLELAAFVRIDELPEANNDGFFIEDGVRYGTVAAWARELGLNSSTIQRKLEGVEGKKGKDKGGRVCDFYPDNIVKEKCKKNLQDIPQADENGFFEIDGVRYGTITAWTRELGISDPTIRRKLEGVEGKKGKDKGGRVCDFYPDNIVKEKCKKNLLDIPQADDGFFVEDGVRYGTIKAWARELVISAKTLKTKLEGVKVRKGKMQNGLIYDFYPKNIVEEKCKKYLQDIPQADENGFFEIDGMRYGTITAWERELVISHNTIKRGLEGIDGTKGKMKGGHIFDFYPGNIVREKCVDLLLDIPQAAENGFFEEDGVRYRTINGWARELKINFSKIKSKLEGIEGRKGKTKTGIRDFYPKNIVEKKCADLLQDIPQADENGFFVEDGVRYGTGTAWARELRIDANTIRRTLEGVEGKKGKDKGGRVCDFYPDNIVKEKCKKNLLDIPQADDGFFVEDGVRYGTIHVWAKELGVTDKVISTRLKKINGISGKTKLGRIRVFFSKSIIREKCSDLFLDIPQADENGFFEKDGMRYRTVKAWARELGISQPTFRVKLKGVEGTKGKIKGQICDFYPEDIVKELCADLLKKKQQS